MTGNGSLAEQIKRDYRHAALDSKTRALLDYAVQVTREPSIQISGELPLDLDYKQELLELRMESERQSSLLERLDQWLPQLSPLDRMRRKAGGNGHGLR